MKTDINELKKHFLLLKEIFLEAAIVRDKSFAHHEKKKFPRTALSDLELPNGHLNWDEAYHMGFAQQEFIMNKHNWDIEELFKMAANVNVFLDSTKPRLDYEGYPKILDNVKIDEIIQSSLDYIKEFEKHLKIG